MAAANVRASLLIKPFDGHKRQQPGNRFLRPRYCTTNAVAGKICVLPLASTRSTRQSWMSSRKSNARFAAAAVGSNGEEQETDDNIQEIPLSMIRRPLARSRSNDAEKVQRLAESIAEIGLLEPIDVLEVDGSYYGFSGCHRYEAHQVLGKDTIRCNIIKATEKTLRMHLM
mmetsp:Transcript_15068/g.28958  ORF Transcript_15068/g.28958 Transcript_15068/m.28958 type:complete len:171 (+) Transcript_15068:119-631(+)